MADPLRWLVLGAGGRLGRRLCTPARPWLVGVDRAHVDAAVPDAVLAAIRFVEPFGVLNLAAAADVARCERDPLCAFEGNVSTARGATMAAGRAGKPIVHVSTDYVFGNPRDPGPRGCPPWWPNDSVGPVNVYGRTKLAAEEEVRAVVRSWIDTRGTIARMSFLADPPGYAWVIGCVRVTKEWIDSAADRLAAFLQAPTGAGTRGPGLNVVHLVPDRDTTLDALVHERYPDVPVVPYAEAVGRLPYRLPADLRLGGAWRA